MKILLVNRQPFSSYDQSNLNSNSTPKAKKESGPLAISIILINYDRPKRKRKSQLSVVQSNGLNRIDQGSSTTSEVNINYKRLYDIEKRATISTSKLDRSNSHSSYCFSNHFPSLIEWIKKGLDHIQIQMISWYTSDC